jgi:NTE family protein
MLKALFEYGIVPDMLVGTSVGAINAAVIAYNPTYEGVKNLEKMWLSIQRKTIFPLSLRNNVLGLLQQKNHLINPKGLKELIQNNLPYTNFEDVQIPIYVVAMDINTGEEVVFSRGPALPALLASAAIPMIYPPVQIGHHALVDRGVINNSPISTAVHYGTERVIVLPTGYTCDRKKTPQNLIEMALTSSKYATHRKLGTDLLLYKDKVILRMIPSLCPLNVSSHDFSQTKTLIERSYQQTKTWLAIGSLESETSPKFMKFHEHI